MNILIDAHVFDGKHQGTRTYLKEIYSELIILKPNWIFYILAEDIENLQKEFGYRDNIVFLKLKSHNKFYRLFVEIPSLIKKHKIEYTHFQYITPIRKVGKYIVTTHDILFEQKKFKKYFPLKYRIINGFLFRYSAKRADILLTVSEYSRKKISELYHIPIEKIFVTPNAVNKKFTLLKESENPFKEDNFPNKYIFYVSRIEPRKNHLIILKAFVDLKLYEKGYSVVFAGSKDFPDKELVKYLENNSQILENTLFWKNNLSINELKYYYVNCELFVFPSHAEGFGIPVLEAMIFNKKVLISNQTAMKDFDLPLEMTFDPNNLQELKQKLNFLLFSQHDINEELYHKILSKFDWNKSANILANIIAKRHEKK